MSVQIAHDHTAMAFHFLISKRGFAFFEGPADAAAAPDASTIAVSAILRFLARENEWDVESSWKNQNLGLGVYPEFFERGFGVEKKLKRRRTFWSDFVQS